jgi:hypothetical protein
LVLHLVTTPIGRLAVLAAALLVGCTALPLSPAPSSFNVPSSPTAASTVPSPTVGPTPIASPFLRSGIIDQRYTTPALEYRSTGNYLLWSTAVRAAPEDNIAPDLFGCEPGGPVSLLYDNPNRDSRLELVGGDGHRIVFVEDNARVFGPGGWKMWYLAEPGAQARLIDENSGNLPFFDVSGTRLVWMDLAGDQTESKLWLLELDTMQRRLLLSADSTLTQFWFPRIDDHLVVYATLELTADKQGEDRHVYLLDLGGDEAPRRLDTSGTASMPDIRGDTVVWKESDLEESHLVAGPLVRYSLSTGRTERLTLNPSLDRYTFPSIGERYVAAWSDGDRALYVADLVTGAPLKILDLGPSNEDFHENVGQIASLAGDLLAYPVGPAAKGPLELHWVVLGR